LEAAAVDLDLLPGPVVLVVGLAGLFPERREQLQQRTLVAVAVGLVPHRPLHMQVALVPPDIVKSSGGSNHAKRNR
jgi:hypothetical protein